MIRVTDMDGKYCNFGCAGEVAVTVSTRYVFAC